MPVVARYGKISLEFCKQLCSHIGCTGLNYYYSFDGCELMKLPYDRKSIYIYRSDEEVSFEFSIYCIGKLTFTTISDTVG